MVSLQINDGDKVGDDGFKLCSQRIDFFCVLMVSAVRNIQSMMLKQISSVVEDEVSEMTELDVVSASAQQSQLEYGSLSYTDIILLLKVYVSFLAECGDSLTLSSELCMSACVYVTLGYCN